MTTSKHRGRKRSAPIAIFSKAVAVFAAAVTSTLVVAVDGAFADPGNTSHVDVVTATVDVGGIAVTGRATFVDVPGVVGEDAADDAVGSAVPLGHELTTATISRLDPFGDMLRFTLGIANQPETDPETNGVPEFVVYRWDFTVAMGTAQQRDVTLRAWRTSQGRNRLQREPWFETSVCTNDDDCANRNGTGSMGDGTVAWDVRMGQDIGLGQIGQAGDVISADGQNIQVTSSAAGAEPPDSAADGVVVLDDMATDTAYTVPGPGVRIGIAPAGTAPQDVPLTVAGTVNSQGAFTGRLPKPATPGAYTVAVQACHGADSCGITATNVTVS